MKSKQFAVGDTVQYSKAFLRSIGADKQIADIRGTVLSVNPVGQKNQLVTFSFQGEIIKSLASNLETI